ncbi:hypothetical protein CsSME_00018595 [Camellia sinensis var. sinensis]
MVMEPFLYSSLVGMTFLSCLKKLKQTVYLEIPTSFLVLPLHGSMPTINQCEIFDCPHANVRLKKQELASFAKSDEDVLRAIEQSVKRDFRVRKTVELHDANDTGNGGSLDNAKCKLLNWDGTKAVVVEDTISSTDSKALVHHMPLGLGCWKVWVNHIIVNAPLFRPNREMFVLENAIGSTVAWPTHFISFDFE